MGGAASRISFCCSAVIRGQIRAGSVREALAAAATAHVVTCEGVRRERAAAAAVSPRRAWRSVSPNCWAQFLRLVFRRDCATE